MYCLLRIPNNNRHLLLLHLPCSSAVLPSVLIMDTAIVMGPLVEEGEASAAVGLGEWE